MTSSQTISPSAANSAAPATEFSIRGMNCQNCARHVAEAIQGVAGVRSATVSLETGSATVRWDSGAKENVSAIIAAVKTAGYEAKEIQNESCGCHSCHTSTKTNWHLNLWLGIFVTAFLMIGEWGFGWMMKPWFQWVSFALAGVVQVFCGAQFYNGAWRQLKLGRSNMDTLVALGSTTAFGFSCWVLFGGTSGHLYFMEAAAIITLISLGHFFEARVSEKASGALKSLLNLTPQTAKRIQKSRPQSFDLKTTSFSQSAIEEEIPVSELQIGDRIALRPGDRVPVDGFVVEGGSAVDESSLTGESNPVDKKSGAELFTGTVNLNGRLVMRVTATGEETALAHVIAAVQRAQSSRAEIQRLGDRVSSIFVPAIVVIAIAAGIVWGIHSGAEKAFVIAAGILIIACPCAMGLATPIAIMAGANAASRRGILIRDGVALEKAGAISAIVFDKTGTLTVGKPELAKVWEVESPKSKVQSLAAALARNSTHPVSQTIARLSEDKIELADWKEIRGAGVEAKFSNSEISRLGSLNWLRETGVDLAVGTQFISEWSNQGATIVGLATEKELLGLFAVRDTLKSNAVNVVGQLQRHDLEIYLVTGDNSQTAAAIAKQAGIAVENVFAEVRPEQKAEFVKKLQAQGECVAFVGDGINDAPALTQADLGIAVSRASDIAREAADIILLKSEIEAVPEALGLSRATLRTIKQNLFWAFFYNALGVPLAAMGFISPIFCAVAMGASDLIVIGNALRLLRWKNPGGN
jgi:Cu+-exporting ATPase